jgi:hypothetical protein
VLVEEVLKVIPAIYAADQKWPDTIKAEISPQEALKAQMLMASELARYEAINIYNIFNIKQFV